MTNQSEENCAVCPFLGIERDSETHFVVPDGINLCHQTHPPRTVNLKYQVDYCLTTNYDQCDGFLAGWGKELPDTVFQQTEPPTWNSLWGFARPIFAGLVVLGLAIWLIAALPFKKPTTQPGITQTPIQTSLSLPAVLTSPAPVLSATPTPTRTPTPMPTPTMIPSQTPGPLIETPMGLNRKCLVHLVVEGDSLSNLSERYNTSMPVLIALNGDRVSPIWLGAYVVICLDQMDAAGLPKLNPQFLTKRTRVEDLAAEAGVSSTDLMEWNGLESEWIDNGRWVILPQP